MRIIYNCFLIVFINIITIHAGGQQVSKPPLFNGGLKDYYHNYFPIGVAVSLNNLKGDESALILHQFNSLTPENVMKMAAIHPKENLYYWKDADSVVAYARRNGLKVRGHNLCWHQQTPDWMFKDSAGKQVTKEVLLQRLKEHITAVVSRYKGSIYAWDVVNEAVSDKGDEYLRNSLWYQKCGEDYIAKAFEYAHEADPDAILFYNDYGEINPAKRKKIIRLINQLKAANVPVQGIGLQCHWSIDTPLKNQLDSILKEFASTGLTVQITELDMSVYPAHQQAVSGKDLFYTDTTFNPKRESLQIDQYKTCFQLFRKYKAAITGITFWNLSDRHSWLDNFPIKGRKDYPLLFNTNLQPKKSFDAIISFPQ